MDKQSHHKSTDPKHNNPNKDRFKKLRPRHTGKYSRVAFVLQGGGSLGAYQMGALKGLLEAGYEPDWIAATSIGAIQAAIVVGNKPEDRIPRLEEFWRLVSTYSVFDIFGHSATTLDLYNHLGATAALTLGQRAFYRPRWNSPYLQMAGTPDKLSFYDTSPLRQTLLDLIDFDLLNKSKTRLSLGAVQASTGFLVYFNNINYLITPDHIMGSAALPPGFPAVKIDNEYYWDGGIHSNTPLEVILDAKPGADTLCFVIDCFGGIPFVPTDMDGVSERTKDIGYSTHARRSIIHYVERQNLQYKLKEVASLVPAKKHHLIEDIIAEEDPYHYTLVHLAYSARIHRSASKDYNFGQVTTQKRIIAGYKDFKALLAEQDQWNYPLDDLHCRFYEAPNNATRLMRKGDL
ncbi:MAG: patatin-like phospholipase family protein [Gammaproteobacteria bacterium]|nr:patatin-like phospholipase family protein [Gammaproteobacteria bacterium]